MIKKIAITILMAMALSCASVPSAAPAEDRSLCGLAKQHAEAVGKEVDENDADDVSASLIECVETEFGDAYFIYELKKHHAVTHELLALMHIIMILKKDDGEWKTVIETPLFRSSGERAVPPHRE